jgi:hypothetical protein
MSEVATPIPTCGRVVHYFPNETDPICSQNKAGKYAAIVGEANGLKVDLSIHTMNDGNPVINRFSVEHKSAAGASETQAAYWDWPERQ